MTTTITKQQLIELAVDHNAQSNWTKENLRTTSEYASLITNEYNSRLESKKPEEAAEAVLSIRKWRHNLWLAMIKALAPSDIIIDDIRFSDFIIDLVSNLDKEEWIVMDHHSLRLTPDFLMMHEGVVIVGDLTVTKTPADAQMKKRAKYLPIINFLRSNDIPMVEMYITIEEELLNLHNMMGILLDRGIIKTIPTQTQRISHMRANIAMSDIIKNSENPAETQAIIDSDTGIKNEGFIDYFPDFQLGKYIPDVEVNDIVNQLKAETDKEYPTFFDDGFEDSQQAFENLWEGFRSREPHQMMRPKATLPFVYNTSQVEEKTGHDLIKDYYEDLFMNGNGGEANDHILEILPNPRQCEDMKDGKTCKDVHGKWQYDIDALTGESGLQVTKSLMYNKKNNNEKKIPQVVDPEEYDNCTNKIESIIRYLGDVSEKPKVSPNDWQSSTPEEAARSRSIKDNYDYISSSNAAQLCKALDHVWQRIMHVSAKLSKRINVVVPPNGAMIFIFFKEHSIISDDKCALPFKTICRYKKGSNVDHLEFEYTATSDDYDYYISKLARLPLSKLQVWDQSQYTLLSTGPCFLEACKGLNDTRVRPRINGILTLLMIDSHQKTSELLELVKYVSFMPFASVSLLSKLIEDKMNLLTKTALDIWVLKSLESFMNKLSTDADAKKRKIKVSNGMVTNDSFGMTVILPSFLCDLKHESVRSFTEEIALLFNCRAKKLYGGQFMDKSMTKSADYELEYKQEVEKYGNWVIDGTPNYVGENFPFESRFAFNASVIAHSIEYNEKHNPINKSKALNDLIRSDFNKHLIHSCSLRGSLKEKHERMNLKDFGSTSLDEALKFYDSTNYSEDETKPHQIALRCLKETYIPQYSMSEKEQRGGGRPIATPTLIVKAANLCIEKPEQSIGKQVSNNIIVPGKNKLKTQETSFKRHLQDTVSRGSGFQTYHATEDQTQFSETDNTRKYLVYFRNNTNMPESVRKLQYKCMEKLVGREHIVRRVPKDLINEGRIQVNNKEGNGIICNIGWPQGMLNSVSTTLHSLCDYYSVELFKIAYPLDSIIVTGLVHSDDSWFAMSCKDLNVYKKYVYFRMLVKRMFCLKLNIKKFWGSPILGELVSNFNNNGDVSIPVMKMINSSTQSLMYQSYPMDMSNQVSTLQQMLRNGANNNMLICVWTVLRNQIISCYNLKPIEGIDRSTLPIELGGIPSCSAFELAMCGTQAHYNTLYEMYSRNPTSIYTEIMAKVLYLSMTLNKEGLVAAQILSKLHYKDIIEATDEDMDKYNSITLFNSSEIFSAITQILPKTKKVSKTIDRIKRIPFETDGLEDLVSRPPKLSVALGHIKKKMPSIIFEFASENYTGSNRRMAAVQAMRATGENYRLLKSFPMKIEDILKLIITTKIPKVDVNNLKVAFSDETGLVDTTRLCVHHGCAYKNNKQKVYSMNKFPEIVTKYHVLGNLRDALLTIVGTDEAKEYITGQVPQAMMNEDANNIRQRFTILFNYYNPLQAAGFIMMSSWSALKPRLFTQPILDQTDIKSFVCDLYGSILDSNDCYTIELDINAIHGDLKDNSKMATLHTAMVLGKIYPEVVIDVISGVSPREYLSTIEYPNLTAWNTLRYAICNYVINNDRKYLDDYYKNKEMSSKWIVAQKKSNKGWHGKFEWLCHYQGLTVKLEGEPKDIKITVNKTDLPKLLYVMKKFVDDNFRVYSYKDPNKWGNSEFWDTKIPGTMFRLSYISSVCTQVRSTGNGVDYAFNTALKFSTNVDRACPEEYDIDHNLTRVMGDMGGGNWVKVGLIRQDLPFPLGHDIVFKHNYIQGITVERLMDTGILRDLTLGKELRPTVAEMTTLLMFATFDPTIYTHSTLVNLLNHITSSDLPLVKLPDFEDIPDVEEMETKPINLTTLNEIAMVQPEVVDVIDDTTLMNEASTGQQGRLKCVNQILMTLCQSTYRNRVEINPYNLVHSIVKDYSLISFFKELTQTCSEEVLESISCKVPMEINLILFANRIDVPSQWSSIDIEEIIESDDPPNKYCHHIAKEILSHVGTEDAAKSVARSLIGRRIEFTSDSSDMDN